MLRLILITVVMRAALAQDQCANVRDQIRQCHDNVVTSCASTIDCSQANCNQFGGGGMGPPMGGGGGMGPPPPNFGGGMGPPSNFGNNQNQGQNNQPSQFGNSQFQQQGPPPFGPPQFGQLNNGSGQPNFPFFGQLNNGSGQFNFPPFGQQNNASGPFNQNNFGAGFPSQCKIQNHEAIRQECNPDQSNNQPQPPSPPPANCMCSQEFHQCVNTTMQTQCDQLRTQAESCMKSSCECENRKLAELCPGETPKDCNNIQHRGPPGMGGRGPPPPMQSGSQQFPSGGTFQPAQQASWQPQTNSGFQPPTEWQQPNTGFQTSQTSWQQQQNQPRPNRYQNNQQQQAWSG